MLKLRDYKILIIDPKSSKVVYTLLFKHIKRYGVSQKRGGFRLNTGRQCFIGGGILDFFVKPFEKVGEIKDTLHGWAGLKGELNNFKNKNKHTNQCTKDNRKPK